MNLPQHSERLRGLDLLRGLSALAVMVFHYDIFRADYYRIPTLLGVKLGHYAVSVFYMLSGLSLGIAYLGRMGGLPEVRNFAIRRVFRILPLYWLTCAINLYLARRIFPDTFWNLSLLFGFVGPERAIVHGGWSLGNEVIFYMAFSAVAWRGRVWMWWVLVATLSVALGCISFALSASDSGFPVKWALYVTPANHICLFFLGVIMATWRRYVCSLGQFCVGITILAAGFWFYPVNNQDFFGAIQGWSRLGLTVPVIGAVYLFYIAPPLPGIFNALGVFFGDRCYGIYLLHPIVWVIAVNRLNLSVDVAVVAGVLGTIAASSVCYALIEHPAIAFGKKLTKLLSG